MTARVPRRLNNLQCELGHRPNHGIATRPVPTDAEVKSAPVTGIATATAPHTASAETSHTFGTLLAAEGTPVADLRGLMGHASLATTQGYVDSVARDRQAAAAANPALRHLRARNGR